MKIAENKWKIIHRCAQDNDPEYNFHKIIEELAEFQEAIVKQKTKHPDNPDKPSKISMIKEFGDVIYRGIIYLHQEFPEMGLLELLRKVDERIDKKLSALEEVEKEKPTSKHL